MRTAALLSIPSFRQVLAAIAASATAACASTSSEHVDIVSEAGGSSYFSLGAAAVSKIGSGQHVAGRVCRLELSTLLSPPSIRVEHRNAQGGLLDTTRAYVPEIYLARDQNCSDYVAKVRWRIDPGDIVRACFDHGTACPAEVESKAVVKAPARP